MPILVKKSGAFLSIGPSFNRAQVSGLLIENHCLDVLFIQNREDILASLGDQAVGKEVSVPDDHA